ncbi:Cyclin-G2 [Echinococcus granulosus]|uniref:Cyclin-G2 n=1 Tax=Echinococcus granulosus TaxID=6210 RepID=U6IZ58_ECHGR|nr:Cyclin-G2 [Echinococcus granulosus]EUB62442.1 Cyclin-G2 [Echinococcus granulosus]CDS17023.1 cyclin G2 [Echinococcus granulosus]
MVEVTHGISGTLTNEDASQPLTSPKLHVSSGRLPDDHMAAVRRTAASKRSLLKIRASRSITSCNRSDLFTSRDESKSPSSPSSSADEDPKRSKAERPSSDPECSPSGSPKASLDGQTRPLFQRRTRNHSAPILLTSIESCGTKTLNSPAIVCELSRIPKHRLQKLLKSEPSYHPNNAFLYYVDPVVEDKVDANLRNEAVHSLRFMHNAFFTLSAEAFCKAVNLIDRFIVKVKVKPKYMACVAAAAYYVAAKLVESTPELGVPSPDALVQISHCGGTAADLLRMEDILTSKLGGDLDGVNAFDFLRLFASAAIVLPEGTTVPSSFGGTGVGRTPSMEAEDPQGQLLLPPNSMPESKSAEITTFTARNPQSRRMYDIWSAMTSRLVVSLCSLEIYRFRPATVALAVLHHFRVSEVEALAQLCGVQMNDVHQCSALVEELYDVFYRDSHPSSRKALAWTLSKRTLLRIGCSSPTTLDTISEDCETDKEDNLQFMFEP